MATTRGTATVFSSIDRVSSSMASRIRIIDTSMEGWGAVKQPRGAGTRRKAKKRHKGAVERESDGQDRKEGPPPTAPVPSPRRVVSRFPEGARKTPPQLRCLPRPAAPTPSIGASAAAVRPRNHIPRRARSPERGEMANTPGGSLIDGAVGSNTVSANGGRYVSPAPHLISRQVSGLPTARRSSRSTPNPYRGHPPLRLGSEALGSYGKKRKAPTEEAPRGISEVVKISDSAPLTPRDPNRTYSSNDSAKGRMSERTMVGNAGSSTKKRKCMSISNYLSLFKAYSKGEAAAVGSEQSSSIHAKTSKVKESPFQKLQRLPDGCHPDFDNDHLFSVNKLRKFWHKSQGAVFVDDKEHVMKTILFILSVLPDACQPFLLLTTASLPSWVADFNRFAPSINIVVYDGEKDAHKLVQNPEFHENRRQTMLHVILAHPDAILENIKMVECIGWEAVIVDYCQSSVQKHLKQLKQLPTDFRMVVLSSPPKDNLLDYKNLLAFLNSEQEDNGDYVDADALAMLRARFTRHIAYERKAGSSNFLEYWVPAYLSQVQLELYSSMLHANSSILQSQMATDSVGALRDIVMCFWKFCNHPSLIGLQHTLVNTTPDVTKSTHDRVGESGKLQLLEKMLQVIRNKRLRVVILFHSDGAVGDGMGNILEELVRHRFGPESCARIQNRSAFSVKQEAMNMFNDITKGLFVFLIDSRACHSSINLSSVDTIIIYGSDLNPLNDLKALRKIRIESQLKCVRVFRLYTPFTVEEKCLVLAKQSMISDNNRQDILPSLSHCLLSWGAAFLFSRVDEFQQDDCARESYERGTVSMMDKIILEISTELSTDIEDSCKVNSAIISKACMSGEFYSRNITLIGEREGVSSLDGDPPKFWLNLLDGNSRCQRYKGIKVLTEETNGARRKLRKTGENAGSSSKFSSDVINKDLFPEIGTPSSADLHLLPETGRENLSTPKSYHAELKSELSKLIKVLKLPDNVCLKTKQLLEYLLENHLVVREPQGILHTFNIALCWHAASLLKYTKLDHGESLALAADCLHYECNEELTRFFYKQLGILKEKQAMDLHGSFTNDTQESLSATEQMVSDGQELVSAPEVDREYHLSNEEPPGRTAAKRIDLFNNVFSLREKNIIEKQQLEILELRAQRDKQAKKLKDVCHVVVRHIRISDIGVEIRNDQIKLVIEWFTMLMHAFLVHMKLQLAKLDALQSTTWVEEHMMKEKLKEEVLSGQLDQFSDLCNILPDSGFVVEEFIHFKKQNHFDNILALGCDQLLDERLMEITLVRNSVQSEAFSTCAVRNEHTEAHMRSGGGASSESLDLPDGNIHCSSDGIDLQRACSASTTPASHDSINQESLTGETRSIEHAKRDNTARASMLPGVTSLVMGINEDDDGTVGADPDHLESPTLASPQNLMTLQHRPVEAEPTETFLAMEAQDLQTEMQISCPTLDAQHQMMCPDDSSKINLELDTAAEMLQEGTTSGHLGDSCTGVKDKNVDTVAADPLYSENQSYMAPNNIVVLPDAREAETQTDQSSLPSQQNFVISGHPPAEAEPSSYLDTDAASSFQLDVHPSSSLLDADSSQTGPQPETTPVLSQGVSTYHHLDDGRIVSDADSNGTVCAHQAHSESPTFAAPQRPAMLPCSSEVGTHANLSSTSCLQSSDAPSGPPPAVAESPGMLGTQVEQDLHPDMAPSTSLLGVPLQRMFLDENQTGCRADRATDLSEEGETEYLSGGTCNMATLPVSREAETENGQASMPAQDIRSLHAQCSLATSHLPVDDLQPPTSILAEEPERVGMLCAAAARDLQRGMQPSITTHDVGLQRTDLSVMPVTRSTAIEQSVEPSWGPHAEQAGTLGMLSASDLRLEVQLSSLTQDQPAEAEGAGALGTIVAQNLQPETQSSTTSDQHVPLDLQPNTTLGPEQLTQLLTAAPAASHNLLCSLEPLRNELERLKYVKAEAIKEHEKKKSLLQTECNQELEKIMKKYELLLHKENSTHHEWATRLDDIYRKVFVQQSLGENFREKFMKSTPAQERSTSPGIQQAPQPFLEAPATQTTALPVALLLPTRPPVSTSFHSMGPCVQPSQVAWPSASGAIPQQSVLPGNLYRATPSPLSSMPMRNGGYGAVGAQGRGPAPHLQQTRMPAPSVMVRGEQQQLGVINPGITSSRQYAPGLLGSFASVSALAGVPLTSTAASSVRGAIPSAASSLPSLPASSSLLPGSAPELMANFVQPPSTTPVPMAAQQAPGLIPGLHHTAGGPLNGSAGIWQAGGHLAGMNQAAPEASREALLLFQRQWPHAMPGPSSVRQTMATTSNSHPGFPASSISPYLMGAQQAAALILNPAFDNMAAGVWHGGALPVPAVANQPGLGSVPLTTMGLVAGRTGVQASGPGGTRAQGGARGEVVCLSDDED